MSLSEIIEKILKEKEVEVASLAKQYGLPIQELMRILSLLRGISSDGEKIVLNNALELALSSMEKGVDPKIVAKHLSWKEFEEETVAILERLNYEVIRGYRFSGKHKRREVDVIGIDYNCRVLVIDCKHWNPRNTVPSRLYKITQYHKERISDLIEDKGFINIISRDCSGRNYGRIEVIPVIVTLYSKVKGIINGVPVVPISFLLSFLRELDYLMDTIYFYNLSLID